MSRGRAAFWALAMIALWNGAFALLPRWGIWTCVGSAAAVLVVATGFGIALPWRALLVPRASVVGLGIAAAAALSFASEVVYPMLASVWPALGTQAHQLYALFGRPTAVQAWVLLPAIAASEELIFRGGLVQLLARERPWVAGAISVLVYTVAHLESGSWALVGLAAFCGSLWTLLRLRSGSLWPGLLCHVLWDLLVLVIRPLA